jgi:hypothetical protein
LLDGVLVDVLVSVATARDDAVFVMPSSDDDDDGFERFGAVDVFDGVE